MIAALLAHLPRQQHTSAADKVCAGRGCCKGFPSGAKKEGHPWGYFHLCNPSRGQAATLPFPDTPLKQHPKHRAPAAPQLTRFWLSSSGLAHAPSPPLGRLRGSQVLGQEEGRVASAALQALQRLANSLGVAATIVGPAGAL